MIIAVDFDGTICDPNNKLPSYRMGQPEPGAVASIRKLAKQGHTIIIFTARNVNKPEAHKAVADWLEYFHIPHHGITNIKQPYFDVIIDNRNIHYDNWPHVMMLLTKMQTRDTVQV